MEELTLIEFKKKIRKGKSDAPRQYRITNSLGIRDAFLFLQRNKWFNIGRALPESVFQKIIREVNTQLAYDLMEGKEIVFPEGIGAVEVRKRPRYVTMRDGKIETNYRIDWDKTLELWYNDAEAYKNRTIVRDTSENERFYFFYNRSGTKFNNKCYTQFYPQRAIRRVLSQHVKQGDIDAYNYGRIR